MRPWKRRTSSSQASGSPFRHRASSVSRSITPGKDGSRAKRFRGRRGAAPCSAVYDASMRPLLIVLVLGLALPCAAIPTTFPPHEDKCAAAVGVSLAPVKGREYDPKRAAWVCPVIVRGQVVDVQTTAEGVYHTVLSVH